jgi:hypothetical protein
VPEANIRCLYFSGYGFLTGYGHKNHCGFKSHREFALRKEKHPGELQALSLCHLREVFLREEKR